MTRKTYRDDEPALRLREPSDVLCAIPYLIGYHPDDSAVLIGLRGKSLYFTFRLDLPPADTEVEELEVEIGRIGALLNSHGITGVVLAGYGPEDRVRPLLTGLRRWSEDSGLRVQECLRAEDGRYWSYLCSDPECCPLEGTPYDVKSGRVAAEATLAGRVALPDLDAYAAQLEPVERTPAILAAGLRARARLDSLTGGVDEFTDVLAAKAGIEAVNTALARHRAGTPPSDSMVAWLALLLKNICVRDHAWTLIADEPDTKEDHRTLWLDVMRRCPSELYPAPATLFAFAAWRCGEATHARIAIERVLTKEPDYTLAWLLSQCLVLNPSTLDDVRIRSKPRGRRGRRRSSRRRAGSQSA